MRHGLWVSLLSIVALPASGQEPTLVVENGRVVVGDGTVLERGSVVVSGDRILSVTGGSVAAPGARRIDAGGKTVLPGFFDSHVHLLVGDMSSIPRSEDALRSYVRDDLPALLRDYLEAGITTVVSTGDFWPAIRRVRERIRDGRLSGPRVFTSGPVFTAPGGHPAVTVCGGMDGWRDVNPWCREHMAVQVDTRPGAREAVEQLAREGVDLIKIVYDSTSPPGVDQLETDVMREIVAAAHARGLKAYAHINEMGDAITAMDAGLDGLVHTPFRGTGEGQREQLVQKLAEGDVTTATTSVTLEALRDRFAGEGDDDLAAWFDGNLQERLRTIRRMAELNPGLVVLGTDTPQLPPGEAFHREVRLLEQAGLTSGQIIRSATRNAATHLERQGDLGTLEAGKLADLVVVRGNPLEDLSALRNVAWVVKGGEIVFSRHQPEAEGSAPN